MRSHSNRRVGCAHCFWSSERKTAMWTASECGRSWRDTVGARIRAASGLSASETRLSWLLVVRIKGTIVCFVSRSDTHKGRVGWEKRIDQYDRQSRHQVATICSTQRQCTVWWLYFRRWTRVTAAPSTTWVCASAAQRRSHFTTKCTGHGAHKTLKGWMITFLLLSFEEVAGSKQQIWYFHIS